jgi:tetratricopeptide (TPR) repeat protein
MLRRLLAVTALCLMAFSPPGSARSLIETINGEQPITLKSVKIDSHISGDLAETAVRMEFFNPNGRPLEGRVKFPLLPGQQVTGFSLDFNGVQRAAVPVEKSKGRQILEAVERRGVDPGLLETTEGNSFSLKLYPVPVQGSRIVELHYSEALAGGDGKRRYRLPLNFGDAPVDIDLSLSVSGEAGLPELSGPFGEIALDKSEGGYRTHVTRSQFAGSGSLDMVVADQAGPQSFVQQVDGETYFLSEIPVAASTVRRALPRRITLLWDSSGSGAARSHEAEFALLDRYFAAVGAGEVQLVRLRDRPEEAGKFAIVKGDWSSLRKALEDTIYDGASALADWPLHKGTEEYLLFSDGLRNYGPSAFPALPDKVRLYALNAAVAGDAVRLSALAAASGGAYIAIDPQQTSAAVEALLTDGPHIENLRATGATALTADLPDPASGFLRVAGKLTAAQGELRFTLVQDGKSQDMTLPLSAAAPSHPLAGYLWAKFKLASLAADEDLHRGEIRRLGEQFAIPTRETSLIVLETANDYVRYGVTPPADLKEASDALKAGRGQVMASQRVKQIDSVVAQFEEKIRWWERTYPKGPMPPPTPLQKVEVDQARPVAPPPVLYAPAPSPMPQAAAPPVSAPRAMASAAAPMAKSSVLNAPTTEPEIGIALKKWEPDTPYFFRMKEASPDQIYAIYLDEKPSYANSSAFYLDAADRLFEKGRRDLALRVLSNLAEMDTENRQILRILGYRLMQAGAPELAVPIFEQVRRMAEDEPQSFRDLGLAYAQTKHYQQAIDQLNEVVVRPWDNRFAEIELIALAEMNAIIATAPDKLRTDEIDPRLLRNLPLDLRVVLSWDAADADMDLWVTDPNGEKCFYGNRFTYQGGRLSRDFTSGYGPEEFSLRDAKPGKYKIEANFFGSRQQWVAGATTLQVTLTTGFGTDKAASQVTTLRLKQRGETAFVGEFEVTPKAARPLKGK